MKLTGLTYETIEQSPENFTNAKKIEFHKDVVLNGHVIKQAIIAQGTGGLGGSQTGLFLYNEKGLDDEATWNLEFEASGERQVLLKLAYLADNREIQIKKFE